MRVRISSRNGLEIPESMKEYVTRAIEGLTKYFDQIIDAEVTVTQERHLHEVDVRLHVNGKTHQAHATGDNLKAPLDEAVAKLRRQLTRHKSQQRRQRLTRDEFMLHGKAVDVTGIVPEVPELPVTEEAERRRGSRGGRRKR